MFLTENDLDETYNTSLKVNPPLRTEEDAEAIRQASSTVPSTLSSPTTLPTPRGRRPASSSLRPLA